MQPMERDDQHREQSPRAREGRQPADGPSYPALPRQVGLAHLLVAGIGGAGTNAVNQMIEAGVSGVEFAAMNTDHQALDASRAPRKLRLGERLTRGLGAGGNPELGRRAAEESYAAIRETVDGADMVFIAAGMGGGTGTGGAPLLAQAAREAGALTVAVVTSPFAFERRRRLIAQQGLLTLRDGVDALIVVPNERLAKLGGRDTSLLAAYRMADDVLRQGVQGISDLITIPGLVNLDFADVRAIMADAGSALIATGRAEGAERAAIAAQQALSNPLLDVDISGARGVIFNITGGDDLTLGEVETIADIIGGAAHPDANLVYGTVHDTTLAGSLRITVVATGFEPRVRHQPPPSAALTPGRASTLRAAPALPALPALPGGSTANQSASPTDTAAAPSTPAVGVGVGADGDRDGDRGDGHRPAIHAAAPPTAGDGARFAITPLGGPAAASGDARDATSPMPAAPAVRFDYATRPTADPSPRAARRGWSQARSPSYHGDEFVAADEPEDDVAPHTSRHRWELFHRH